MHNADVLIPLIGLLVLAVPGLLLQLVAGVRDKLWLAALTVPVSVGVFVLAGLASGIPGIDYTPGLVAVVLVVLTALVALGARLLRARRAPVQVSPPAPDPPSFLPVMSARMTRLAQLAAVVLCLVAVALAFQPWRSGLGAWDTYPQEHDTIIHMVLVGYITNTGAGAPWELLPLDMLTGEPVSYYPSGLPLTAAVTGQLAGGPTIGFNVVNALATGPVFVLGCAALAAAIFRRMRAGAAWTALGGGVAAVVAAGLYSPGVNLLHDGGIAPNAVAMSLAPGVIAGLITLGRRQWLRAAVLGLGLAGIFSVHPSVVASVGASVIVLWIVEAFTEEGRRSLRAQWPVLVGAGVVALVTAIGQLIGSASQVSRTGGWPPDIGAHPIGDAVGTNLMLTYGGYLDPEQQLAQVAAGLLALVGVAAVLFTRRGWGALAMWLFWIVVSVSFKTSPTDGFGATVASVFYKSYVRVQAHVSLFVPVLAAIGAVFVAAAIAGLLARWSVLPRFATAPRARGSVLAVLVVLGMIGYVGIAGVSYEHRNAAAIASRYAKPDFVRVDADDRKASEWLDEHVEPGQRVMNSANDGSTYAYTEEGVPVINVVTLGAIQAPYTFALLEHFNEYPTNDKIRSMVLRFNIAYVYVDSQAPVMGAGPGAPQNWLGEPTFTLAPGLKNLAGLPGMSQAFKSGSVTVYKLDRAVLQSIDA